LLGKNFIVDGKDLTLLAKALLILAPLIYGGIYTVNNIHDLELDRLDPNKQDRPLPAGELKRSQAIVIAVVLIASGLLIAPLVDKKIILMAQTFLFFNFLYTFWAKRVPYLELLMNVPSHVCRFLFGVWLAGKWGYFQVAWILFFADFAIATFRRIKELHEGMSSSRPTLRFYTPLRLWILWSIAVLGLTVVAAFSSWLERGVGIFFMAYSLFYALGYFKSKRIRKLVDFAFR
jgi:4-hydroxybenzoate polyprenyltransferase